MAAEKEDIVLSMETEELLKTNEPGCPLCKWILEDFELNKKLTDYPRNFDGSGQFPLKGKELHIKIVKKIAEGKREKKKA